jgi:hypothetical protein
MIYARFPRAFRYFTFYGTMYQNRMLVGKTKTITFHATTSALDRLCMFLPQTGLPGPLVQSYVNPWQQIEGGALAGEAVALTMNITYNDTRLMPRTPGYDLEDFLLAKGPYAGKRVREVLDIANQVLSGAPPSQFGLPSPPAAGLAELTEILQNINSNYEFEDFLTFNDRGYLIPNVSLGTTSPPHYMVVP